MKPSKKMIYNIIFFIFIIFLFTPYGLTTRAKLTQGVAFIKSMMFSPTVSKSEDRLTISSLDVKLAAISNATNINLSEFKGKVIFINYWATWCSPCVAEMPSIQYLYNEYKDKIAFVFLTSDAVLKIENFYKKHHYNLPTYHLASNVPKEIDTKSLPTTFIIDKKGKIVLKETGASNWNSNKIKKILTNLLAE